MSVPVVIQAGGKGTRLYPYTRVLPKPLMPVGDRPILEIVIRQLATAGFRNLHVTIGYLGEMIRLCCGDGSRWGVHIRYWPEEKPLGTMAPLRQIAGLETHARFDPLNRRLCLGVAAVILEPPGRFLESSRKQQENDRQRSPDEHRAPAPRRERNDEARDIRRDGNSAQADGENPRLVAAANAGWEHLADVRHRDDGHR